MTRLFHSRLPWRKLGWMLTVVFCLGVGTGSPAWADADRLTLDRGDFLLMDSTTPPADDGPWQAQSLPDQWRASRPGADGSGWYRFRFTRPAGDQQRQAVYLPKLVMNAAVFLNGVAVGDGGTFNEPVARNWNRPLLFLVPPGLIRPGENTLHLRLRAHAYTQAALYPLFIGPEQALREDYERAYFLRVTINQTATLLIAAIGVLTLGLWWHRRQDTAYAYFGLSALVWAIQSTNLYLRDVPVTTATWEIFTNGGFQVFSGLLLISLLRFIHLSPRPLIAALWLAALFGPVSTALVPAEVYLKLTAFWHLYTLLAAVATLALLLKAAWLGRNRDARLLVVAMGMVVVFALHDWLIHSQHLWQGRGDWLLGDVFLLHYSAPMVFLAVGLIMTGRYVQVLNQFESLNNELEFRVRQEQAKLQDSYSRMRALEMERAVVDERERIYRDLHDDVGAKLLSLVYRAERQENADLARSALSDLREVVSRTGADSFVLDDVVADWRSECDQRLTEAGISLDWQQSLRGALPVLNQSQALNLSRILRESVSNVIRHAAASAVRIVLDWDETGLRLEIGDDGHGVAAEDPPPAGRGMRNMESRALRLGGSLTRHNSSPRGYTVTLNLPASAIKTDTG